MSIVEEASLKEIARRLLGQLRRYVEELETLEPASEEAARLVNSCVKLFETLKDYEGALGSELEDLARILSQLQAQKTTRLAIKFDKSNIEAAVEHLIKALKLLTGERA